MKSADDRYRELRELTDTFKNKTMLKHHLIRTIKEAVMEEREACAKIAEVLFFQALGENEKAEKWLAAKIRSRQD